MVIPDVDEDGPRMEDKLVIATDEMLLPTISDSESFEKLSDFFDI